MTMMFCRSERYGYRSPLASGRNFWIVVKITPPEETLSSSWRCRGFRPGQESGAVAPCKRKMCRRAAGRDVSKFKVGDQVFAFCGAGMGCHAEYKCMPEDGAVALKPANLTYDEAAAISFGGTTTLDFFRRGKLQSGETVLVNGASGGIGTAAVQLAKHFGADVTGVCSTANVELVRSLGANYAIDYTKEDFTENGKTYDVIVDTVGTAPFSRSKGSLRERGRLLLVLGMLPDILQIPWVSMTSSKKIIAGPATGCSEDLRFLAELAGGENSKRSLIGAIRSSRSSRLTATSTLGARRKMSS